MATKAQRFKIQQQRDAKPPKPKRPSRPRRDQPIDTSLPGVSATDRKVGRGNTALRNVVKKARAQGGAALEASATGKPSRKSTRKSTGRAKRTANLRGKAIRKVTSPKAKAIRAKARATKTRAKAPKARAR